MRADPDDLNADPYAGGARDTGSPSNASAPD